jgi:hypothetical protein
VRFSEVIEGRNVKSILGVIEGGLRTGSVDASAGDDSVQVDYVTNEMLT